MMPRTIEPDMMPLGLPPSAQIAPRRAAAGAVPWCLGVSARSVTPAVGTVPRVPDPPAAISGAPDAERLQRLVRRIVDRDESALGAFYDATLSRSYALALRITRDSGLAEDVCEDAYFQVWNDAARYDGTRGAPLAWLLTIVRSRALDCLRRRPAETSIEDVGELADRVDPGDDPADLLALVRERHAVARALASLRPVQRQLLSAAYLRDMSHQEIAAAFAMPLGTVKSTIRLALVALRKRLEPAATPGRG